jgi:hypothetical protein
MRREHELSEKGKNSRGNMYPSSSNSSGNNYNDGLTLESNATVWYWVGGGILLIADVVLNFAHTIFGAPSCKNSHYRGSYKNFVSVEFAKIYDI